jgi:hypothetical protein
MRPLLAPNLGGFSLLLSINKAQLRKEINLVYDRRVLDEVPF